jgi:hypothetical protein
LQAEPDRVARPVRVSYSPLRRRFTRGVELGYRPVAVEDELGAIAKLDLAAPEAIGRCRPLRALLFGRHYALFVGGLAAGFGFLTFGGCFGVLSPIGSPPFTRFGSLTLRTDCAPAS